MKKIFKFLVAIFIPLIVGFLGSIFTSSSVDSWYVTLNKPSFTPPGWLFAPVWTALYILMGISFYIIWVKGSGKLRRNAFTVYSFQLLLNFLWSMFFFGLRSPLTGFIDIVLLWVFIVINIVLFYRISKIASSLLMPYFLWVSFASVLNFSVFILN
jgi:benzodiazapine receptor